jgi:hypothetical protein
MRFDKIASAWKKSIALEQILRSLLKFMPLLTNLARELRIDRLNHLNIDGIHPAS